MAVAALKEQQGAFQEQLNASQANARQQKRMGQVLAFPTGRPVAFEEAEKRESHLPDGERFQAAQARRATEAHQTEIPEGLSALAEQGLLSQQVLEAAQKQAAAILQARVSAVSLQEIWKARQQVAQFRQQFGGVQLSKEQAEQLDVFRDEFWRGIRISLPSIDDFTLGLTLGAGTFLSYFVWIWQFVKGLKYRGETEPLTVTSLLTPPPMPLSIPTKDVAKMAKILKVLLVDVLGFIYENIQVAVIILLIALLFILIAGASCLVDYGATMGLDFCAQFAGTAFDVVSGN